MTSRPAASEKSARPRIRHARRQVQEGLPREIELRRQADFGRAPDAEPLPDVLERAVDGQRRRREHGRAHPIEQQLPHDGRDVDRRGAEEDAPAAELDEVDVVRRRPRAGGA